MTLSGTKRRMTPLGAAVVGLAALLACPTPGWAKGAEPAPERALERVLWRIGVPDGSSGEFRYDFAEYIDPDAAPVFHVDTDAAGTSWRSFHPGPASGTAGGREHPYTILFELPSPVGKAGGVYRLRVSILHQTPRLSHLRVELNGHRGTFYFDSRLDYTAGDQLGLTVPYASPRPPPR